MFEPRAVALVNVSIRNAVPMPMAPVVLPVDAMQAPAAGMVNQLDGRCRAKLDRGRRGRERGRVCGDGR
jgi:hypothetical protein